MFENSIRRQIMSTKKHGKMLKYENNTNKQITNCPNIQIAFISIKYTRIQNVSKKLKGNFQGSLYYILTVTIAIFPVLMAVCKGASSRSSCASMSGL